MSHKPFPIDATVVFEDFVFNGPDADNYYASYQKYKGEVFMVDGYLEEDPNLCHIALRCITDPSIKVDGYVHTLDLKEA